MLSKLPVEEDPYSVWVHTTSEMLAKAFGRESPNISRFADVGFLGIATDTMDEAFYREHVETHLRPS